MAEINFRMDENFIVAEVADENSIIDFQLEMLLNNKIDRLIDIKRQKKNSMTYLYYDIGTRVSWENLFSNTKLNDEQFYDMVESVIKAFNELEDYQLPTGGLCFEPKMIFVQKGSFMLDFLYIPTHKNDKTISEVQAFFVGIVNSFVNFSDRNIYDDMNRLLNENIANISEFERKFIIIKNKYNNSYSEENFLPINNTPVEEPQDEIPESGVKKFFSFGNSEKKQPIEETKQDIAPIPQTQAKINQPASFGGMQIPKSSQVKNVGGMQIPASRNGSTVASAAVPSNNQNAANDGSSDVQSNNSGSGHNLPVIFIGLNVLALVLFYGIYQSGVFPVDEATGQTDPTCFILVPIILFAVNYFAHKVFVKGDSNTNKAENVTKKTEKIKAEKPQKAVKVKPITKKDKKREINDIVREVDIESPRKTLIPPKKIIGRDEGIAEQGEESPVLPQKKEYTPDVQSYATEKLSAEQSYRQNETASSDFGSGIKQSEVKQNTPEVVVTNTVNTSYETELMEIGSETEIDACSLKYGKIPKKINLSLVYIRSMTGIQMPLHF